VLERHDGQVTRVATYVGGRWREGGADVTDLGMVGAADAAAYLLDVAAHAPGKLGDKLVFPATLADSATVWPQLVKLARDADVPRETRKGAVFWLGQAAGAEVTRALGGLLEDTTDREIQKQAVFALSQHKGDDAVPMLIRVAREHKDPEVRKAAMFWLGQTGDPRAVAFFEEVLAAH
jgi:HEAT repeat protein